MIKQNPKNIRNRNLTKENISLALKSTDSYADDLIKSLSEKRENRRAKQTWEWEQLRRKTAQIQTQS